MVLQSFILCYRNPYVLIEQVAKAAVATSRAEIGRPSTRRAMMVIAKERSWSTASDFAIQSALERSLISLFGGELLSKVHFPL